MAIDSVSVTSPHHEAQLGTRSLRVCVRVRVCVCVFLLPDPLAVCLAAPSFCLVFFPVPTPTQPFVYVDGHLWRRPGAKRRPWSHSSR